MVKRIGRARRKTRSKLRKNIKNKGKFSLSSFFQTFKLGEQVLLKAESSIQKGMYLPRYHGKIGKIRKKQGKCYEVMIRDKNKEKILIVHPIHLRKVK